jgi:predicted dehydrogenase
VSRVTGSARITRAERPILSEPLRGTMIAVETPTYLAGVLDFAGGPVGTITTSFDVHAHSSVPGEIYGTEGTLRLSDPNIFVDRIALWRNGEWREFGHTPDPKYDPRTNWRGLGLADMAHAIRTGAPLRVSAELAYHVLDLMIAIDEASSGNTHVAVESTCARPEPLPGSVTTYWPGNEAGQDALSRSREAAPIGA